MASRQARHPAWNRPRNPYQEGAGHGRVHSRHQPLGAAQAWRLGSCGDRRRRRAAPERCGGRRDARSEARRQARRRHRPGLRGHQRDDRLRLPLGPADGLRDVRHAGQVRQPGTAEAAARDEAGRARTRRRRSSRSARASSSTTASRCGSRTSSGASTASTTRSSRRRTTSSPCRRTSGARPSRSTTRSFRITTKKPTRMVESFRFWFIMPENADDLNLGVQADRHGAVPVQELRQGRPARARAVPGLLERRPAVPRRADVPLPRRRGGRRSRTSSRATSSTCTTSRSRRCRRSRASGTRS